MAIKPVLQPISGDFFQYATANVEAWMYKDFAGVIKIFQKWSGKFQIIDLTCQSANQLTPLFT